MYPHWLAKEEDCCKCWVSTGEGVRHGAVGVAKVAVEVLGGDFDLVMIGSYCPQLTQLMILQIWTGIPYFSSF